MTCVEMIVRKAPLIRMNLRLPVWQIGATTREILYVTLHCRLSSIRQKLYLKNTQFLSTFIALNRFNYVEIFFLSEWRAGRQYIIVRVDACGLQSSMPLAPSRLLLQNEWSTLTTACTTWHCPTSHAVSDDVTIYDRRKHTSVVSDCRMAHKNSPWSRPISNTTTAVSALSKPWLALVVER